MNFKILLGFCAALVFAIAEVSGRSCQACGFGSGQDYCTSCKASPYEFRPLSLKPTKNNQKIYSTPVGFADDLCDCRNVNVKPVALPKPKYIWKEKKAEVCDNTPLIPAPDHFHDFTQDQETYEINPDYAPSGCNYQPLYPVDAVSIDLVNRMKQSAIAARPEGQLQYGFAKLPRDALTYKISSNIPEENLNTFDKQIVELKNPREVVTCGDDSEEIILEDREPHAVPYLSYKDLGFVPENAPSKKFITVCKYGKHDVSSEEQHQEKYYPESSEEEDVKYRVKSSRGKKSKSSCGCH